MTDNTTDEIDPRAFDGIKCARCRNNPGTYVTTRGLVICSECASEAIDPRRFRPDPPPPVKLATIEDVREAFPQALAIAICATGGSLLRSAADAHAHEDNNPSHRVLWLRDPAEGTA